jgi:putative ABC transport system substrate-binding protein
MIRGRALPVRPRESGDPALFAERLDSGLRGNERSYRRREFITLLGGAAAAPSLWPLAARAQQTALPVIGFLGSTLSHGYENQLAAFRRGLSEVGYVEGRNVAIEFRWANNQYDRLPALASELVQRRVAVIVSSGAINAAFAAKAATATIPIVFGAGSDPVQIGLVDSLSRPGGNVTGATRISRELLAKRLEVLRELLPKVTSFGLLVNPSNPNTEPSVRELKELTQSAGLTLHVVAVPTQSDFDRALSTLVELKAGAFLYTTDALFGSSLDQMVALAGHYRLPGIYYDRIAVDGGGLISYGSSTIETYRTVGLYTGRILKGAKPSDLPVQESTKVELVINLKTAKALGVDVPLALLVRADELIE